MWGVLGVNPSKKGTVPFSPFPFFVGVSVWRGTAGHVRREPVSGVAVGICQGVAFVRAAAYFFSAAATFGILAKLSLSAAFSSASSGLTLPSLTSFARTASMLCIP